MENVLILLAAYNGEKYIEEMIDSILAQDHASWKLILSDDQSKDGTATILERYAQQYPERIMHYRSGLRFGNAQNHFMHLLKTFHDAPYIMFCDQDDVWHQDKVRKTLEKMKETEKDRAVPVMVHTDLRVVDGQLLEMNPSFIQYSNLDGNCLELNKLLMQNVVTGCTMMINRALAELAYRDVPENGMVMHDWWLALIAAACGKTAFLNEATIDYRQHGNNVVGAKNTKSMSYLLSRVSASVVRKSIHASAMQAKLLLETLETELSDDSRMILQACAELMEAGWLKRRILYIKHGFFKIGLIRRIAQFLCG